MPKACREKKAREKKALPCRLGVPISRGVMASEGQGYAHQCTTRYFLWCIRLVWNGVTKVLSIFTVVEVSATKLAQWRSTRDFLVDPAFGLPQNNTFEARLR